MRWLAHLFQIEEQALHDQMVKVITEDSQDFPCMYLCGCIENLDSGKCLLVVDIAVPAAIEEYVLSMPFLTSVVMSLSSVVVVAFKEHDDAFERVQAIEMAHDEFSTMPTFGLQVPLLLGICVSMEDISVDGSMYPGGSGQRDAQRFMQVRLESIGTIETWIWENARELDAIGGGKMMPDMWLMLWKSCVEEFSKCWEMENRMVDLEAIVNQVVLMKCNDVGEQALVVYSECIQDSISQDLLIDKEKLETLHEEMMNIALKMFHNDTQYTNGQKVVAEQCLRKRIKLEMNKCLDTLKEQSEQACIAVREQLRMEHITSTMSTTSLDEFKMVFESYVDACQQKMKGCAKEQCIRECWQTDLFELFAAYERSLTQKSHQDALLALKLELKQAWAGKEVEMKACMDQKMATMDKLAAVTQQRLKRSEKECQKHVAEMEQLRIQLADHEESSIVASRKMDENQNSMLEMHHKISQLQDTLENERKGTNAIQQLLSESIQDNQLRESQLVQLEQEYQQRIGSVQDQSQDEISLLRTQNRKLLEVNYSCFLQGIKSLTRNEMKCKPSSVISL